MNQFQFVVSLKHLQGVWRAADDLVADHAHVVAHQGVVHHQAVVTLAAQLEGDAHIGYCNIGNN
jgi:hypothetical protein